MHSISCQMSFLSFLSIIVGLLAQYAPASVPQYAEASPSQYSPSSFGRTLGGGRATFPVMTPLSFGQFNMMSMNQQQNTQGAGQQQGSAASTGDLTADSGDISGGQTSNFTTDKHGSLSTAGSQGQCQGIHCNMNGASQVGTQGQFQKQKQTNNNFANLFQSGPAFGFGNFNSGLENGRLTQLQSQFQNSGASVGTGSVDKGAVSSKQDTKAQTNKAGTSVLSTSIGQGYGDNILTSGSTQAKSQGQVARQSQGQNSGTSKTASDDGTTGTLAQTASNSALQTQSQAQSDGSGAATGESGAKSGIAQSAQNSVVNTDGKRSSVNSESIGTASGTGVHVSGAATASGNTQSQSMKQMDLSQFNFGGFSPRSNFDRQSPQPAAALVANPY